MKNKVFVVIPAYNEEYIIEKVINELKSHGYSNIILVDDGSKDKTYNKASKKGIIVLKHIVNRGQGAALKTSIDYALKQGAEIIVTFDADGQHSVEDIKKLIEPVSRNKVDVTLGSRFLNKEEGSNIPFFRKVFLKGGAFIIFLMYGIKLTDSHNGLRAMSRKAAEKIELKSNRMEHASEIIEQIKKKKLRYKEIPVTIKYTEYSKMHGQSTWNAFKIFFKMIFNKLTK